MSGRVALVGVDINNLAGAIREEHISLPLLANARSRSCIDHQSNVGRTNLVIVNVYNVAALDYYSNSVAQRNLRSIARSQCRSVPVVVDADVILVIAGRSDLALNNVSLNSVQLGVYLAVGDDNVVVLLQAGNVRVAGILVQLGIAREVCKPKPAL